MARVRVGKTLLAGDERARHAGGAHAVPKLRGHEPQRREIDAGLRRLELLESRVGLAGIRRPGDEQQLSLARPRAGKSLVKAVQRDAFRHAPVGRAQRKIADDPRGPVDELPHRQLPVEPRQLLVNVHVRQPVPVIGDGFLDARNLRVNLRHDGHRAPAGIRGKLAEPRGQNVRAFRPVERQNLEHAQRARPVGDEHIFLHLRHHHGHVPFTKQPQPARLRQLAQMLPNIAQPRFENGPSAARLDGWETFIGPALGEPAVEFGA